MHAGKKWPQPAAPPHHAEMERVPFQVTCTAPFSHQMGILWGRNVCSVPCQGGAGGPAYVSSLEKTTGLQQHTCLLHPATCEGQRLGMEKALRSRPSPQPGRTEPHISKAVFGVSKTCFVQL